MPMNDDLLRERDGCSGITFREHQGCSNPLGTMTCIVGNRNPLLARKSRFWQSFVSLHLSLCRCVTVRQVSDFFKGLLEHSVWWHGIQKHDCKDDPMSLLASLRKP